MRRLISFVFTLVALAAPSAAQAMAPALVMPSQAFVDAPLPGSPPGQATWSDLPGGLAARPYVKSLSVINGGTATPVFSGGTEAASSVANGNPTAVISPINLCPAGQAPAPGRCYATPNRVSLTFGMKSDQGLGLDLTAAGTSAITADSTLDVVIALNTLGTSLRWTWANGDLISWKTTNLGRADAELHLRIKPVATQWIDWSTRGPVGCTATPIRDCNLDRADASYLGASLVLSLDDTLDAALTGTIFATQGAVAGFLLPERGPGGPSLDLQIAAAHLDADASLHKGAITAILPAGALSTLYGATPEQAQTLFTATRRGDPGTQSTPTFTPIAESDADSAGLRLQISDITFSAPTYRVAPTGKRGAGLKITRKRAGTSAVFTAKGGAACKRAACTITLTTSGQKGAKVIATAKSSKTGALQLKVPAARLKPGSYSVTVRKGKTVLASAALTI